MSEGEHNDSLVIPVTSGGNTETFIEIFPEELKTTPVSTILNVLQTEAPQNYDVWADTALTYMREKAKRQAVNILTAVSSDVKDARILSSLGIALLASEDTEELRNTADQKFIQSNKVDQFYPMSWMGRGMSNLSSGRTDQAKFFFQTTLKECGEILPALLGMATVLYLDGHFQAAQSKYAEIIRRYPNESGAIARVGFGLASYRLGQVDRAHAAFTRALALDPENVDALVGTAVLEMANGTTEQAIKQMSMANLLDHSNAMVQNHLANHYFWKWTTVSGTVTATKNSDIVVAAQTMSLDVGDPVRLGTSFEAQIIEIVDEENDEEAVTVTGSRRYRINKVWKEKDNSNLKVWKKDYDRVMSLARGAHSSTKVPEIQAESLFFLARVCHVRDEIDNAAKFYEKACKLSPSLSPARYGLAQVLVVKGMHDEAAKHLTKLVTSVSHASDAFALLGLLEVKAGKIDEGLVHLRKAIDLDPSNSDLVVLEALALQQHKSSYSKSLECYKRAFDLIRRRGKEVPIELYTNAGVLCHETKLYDEALQMYGAALNALEGATEAKKPALEGVGVGGVRIRQEGNENFFGYVDSGVRALVVGATELKLVPDAPPVASLPFAAGDVLQLGDAISTEIEDIQDKDGVVFVKIKTPYDPMVENEVDGAINTIELRVQRENKLLDLDDATTIAFNIARLHEASGNVLASIELHKAITKRNPTYVNSYLRLACIAVDCGALDECAQWLKIAAATAPGNSEVLTLIGNLHLSLCDWKPAQKVFEGLMAKNVDSVTAYSLLRYVEARRFGGITHKLFNQSMGNIYFANLRTIEKRYGKNLQYASDFYKRILEKDPLNAYAANGLGTVMAERGEIFKAKEIFNRVREVTGDALSDALLNQGHIFLAQKKHSEAIKLYQSYLKRAEDVSTPVTSKSRTDDIVDVLQFIAFAYFDWARHIEMPNDATAAPADGLYKEAMKHLQLAIDKNSKRVVVLRFNLCMTKLQAANCVLQKFTRHIPRTVEEVEEAHKGLEESYQIVEKISQAKEVGDKVYIKGSVLDSFLKLCQDNLSSAKTHLHDERQREQAAKDERELRQQAAEMAIQEEKLREALAQQEEAKRQHERDLRAEANMRKAEELSSGWKMDTEVDRNEKASKGKKNRAPPPPDDFIEEPVATENLFDSDSDDDDDDEVASPSPKKNESQMPAGDLLGDGKNASEEAKTIVQGLFDSDSDDDNKDAAHDGSSNPVDNATGDSENPASARDLFGDSDEESDEELVPNAGAKRPAEESPTEEGQSKKPKAGV